MPNNNYGALLDTLDTHAQASGNIAGTDGVAPEQAASAIAQAPLAGLPASVGMHTPEFVAQQALQRTQQDTLATSAPVARWAATADPAHLAVTKDDFPSLAKIGAGLSTAFTDSFHQMHTTLNQIGDQMVAEHADAWKRFIANPADVKAYLQGGKTFLDLIGTPFAVGASGAGSVIKNTGVPLRDVYLSGPNAGNTYTPGNVFATPNAPLLTDPADRQRRATDWATLGIIAAFGAGRPSNYGEITGQGYANFRPVPPAPEPPAGLLDNGPRPPPPGVDPFTDGLRATVAETDAAAVSELQTQVAESQTHARSPQVMENFLAQSAGERTVAVDPEVLMRLGQEGTIVFPDHGPQIIEAARNGEPVQVPMSTYLARTAGQPFAEELNSVSTFREGGLSVADAKEVPAPAEVPPRPPVEVPVPEDFTPEETAQTRYIAADAHRELESVVQELRLRELFTEAKAVGATKTNFERYSAGIEEQIALATERLTERAVAQVKRERTGPYKEALAQHTAAVEQELAGNPVLTARAELVQGRGPLGEVLDNPLKLDRADTLALYGKDLGLPDRMFGANGVTADEAAEKFGFASGADLIRALAELHTAQGDMTIAQHMKAMIRAEAAQRTRDDLGYDLNHDEIHQLASESITVPAIENFLADDLKAFADEHALPFNKAEVQAAAEERFAQRPVKDAIKIKRFQELINADGRRLETALLAGDIPKAFKAKQDQYMHLLELGQAHKFLKYWNSLGKSIRNISRRKAFKTVDQAYLDQIHQLLSSYKIPVKRDKEELIRAIDGKTLGQFIEEQLDEGQPLIAHDIPANIPLTDLSVEQLRKFGEMYKSLVLNGKEQKQVLVMGQKMALDDAVQQAIDGAQHMKSKPTSTEISNHVGSKAGHFLKRIDASHRVMENLFDIIGNGDINNIHQRLLMDGATEAANTADRLDEQIYAPIVKKYESIPDATTNLYKREILNEVNGAPVLRSPLGNHEPLTILRGDLLPILLNMGTKSNVMKLAEGYHTTPEALHALVNKHITKAELEFVQFTWDKMTKDLFPLADKNARDLRGVGLTKEEAVPQTFDAGKVEGGYYPIAYDPFYMQALPKTGKKKSLDYVKPFRLLTTPSGFEKERTGFVGPVDLNIDHVLRGHLREVFTRVAYGEYATTARRFIQDPRIVELWRAKFGDEYYKELMPWLQRQILDPTVDNIDNSILRTFRRNQSVSVMGGKLSVSIGQIQGLIPVANEIGVLATADGLRTFWWSTITGKNRENITNKSAEIKYRFHNLDQNVRDVHTHMAMMDFRKGTVAKNREEMGRLFMDMLGAADKYLVTGAGWMGAYRKAKFSMDMSEGDAIRYADKVIRTTQGSGRQKDLPAVQGRANELERGMLIAYTWQNRLYNMQMGLWNDIAQGKYWKAAKGLWYLVVLTPIISAVFNRDLPKNGKDVLPWLARNIGFGLIGNSKWTRDLAGGLNRELSGKNTTMGRTQMSFLFDAITRPFHVKDGKIQLDDLRKSKAISALYNALGAVGGLPAAQQLGYYAQATSDLVTNKVHPKSTGDWYELLTTGQLQPKGRK